MTDMNNLFMTDDELNLVVGGDHIQGNDGGDHFGRGDGGGALRGVIGNVISGALAGAGAVLEAGKSIVTAV
jgi:hypothetical protein